jgi:hypothetical protein
MNTENEARNTLSIKMDGQHLSEDDHEVLMRMLPDCCCAKCKHWSELYCPLWPEEQVCFHESLFGGLSCLSTLYSRVDWAGECKRFPPAVAPHDARGLGDVWKWPTTSHKDRCGEFTPKDQPTR